MKEPRDQEMKREGQGKKEEERAWPGRKDKEGKRGGDARLPCCSPAPRSFVYFFMP